MTDIKTKTTTETLEKGGVRVIEQRCERFIESCRSSLKPDQFSELKNLLQLVPNPNERVDTACMIPQVEEETKKQKKEDIIQENIYL